MSNVFNNLIKSVCVIRSAQAGRRSHLFLIILLSSSARAADLPTVDDVPTLLLALCLMLPFCHGFSAGVAR